MEVIKWLQKYGTIITLVLVLFTFLMTCSNKGKISQIKTTVENTNTNQAEADSVSNDLYIISKEELRLIMDIQKYETAKQVLYDWNSVVRTVVRPDDRMNFYDGEIEKLEEQLNTLRANKILKGN